MRRHRRDAGRPLREREGQHRISPVHFADHMLTPGRVRATRRRAANGNHTSLRRLAGRRIRRGLLLMLPAQLLPAVLEPYLYALWRHVQLQCQTLARLVGWVAAVHVESTALHTWVMEREMGR